MDRGNGGIRAVPLSLRGYGEHENRRGEGAAAGHQRNRPRTRKS